MEIAIRAHNVEVSPELHAAVIAKVGHMDRFWEGMDRAEVRFHEEHNPRIPDKEVCEVTMTGAGHIVRARAAGGEKLVALDRVLDKLEHRMEKLKGRMLARSHPRGPHQGRVVESAVGDGGGADPEDDGQIVKVKSFAIKPMTPTEGALQMDMLSHDFFFFTNAETGRAAVVYRRNDGQIGLIDST